MTKKYTIRIERGENNYPLYVPDLPECVATGTTIDKLKERMHGAIEMYLEGMREDGDEEF